MSSLSNKNVPFMVSYALDINYQAVLDVIDSEESQEDLLVLFVKLLVSKMQKLINSGNVKEYQSYHSIGSRVIGRIDFYKSAKESILGIPKWHCEYSNLSTNIDKNLVSAFVLNKCLSLNLTRVIKNDIYQIISFFNFGILPREINFFEVNNLIRKERNKDYQQVLRLCEFIILGISLSGEASKKSLSVIVEDKLMPLLFEKFLFNFLHEEVDGGVVYRKILKWNYESLLENSSHLLPIMKPDIILEFKDRLMIIDAKYYKNYLNYGYYDPKIRSDHLFQIEAYLNNFETVLKKVGVLIYPDNSEFNIHAFRSGEKKLIVSTIPIGGSWQKLKDSLLEVIGATQVSS